MNESLFTDLSSDQAETLAAGLRPPDSIPPVLRNRSLAVANFGSASALINIARNGFTVSSLHVEDSLRDGHPVYAKFQARTTDGSTLFLAPKCYDKKGEAGNGTDYRNLRVGSSKPISQVRVMIYNDVSGTDPVAAGNWVPV